MSNMQPKEFKDKNGTTIFAGDVLLRIFFARWRERPGHRRIAINGMSGNEVIVMDEGPLKDPHAHWVKYHVKWSGACLIAERGECSDYQVLSQAEKFDAKGREIHEGGAFHYMNSVFDSTVYEVQKMASTNGNRNKKGPQP